MRFPLQDSKATSSVRRVAAALLTFAFVVAGTAQAQESEKQESSKQDARGDVVTVVLTDLNIEVSDPLTAGETTLEIRNAGEMEHSLTIERQPENPESAPEREEAEAEESAPESLPSTLKPGEAATLTVNLEPGSYVFWCPVDDHRAQGMELTVKVEKKKEVTSTTR